MNDWEQQGYSLPQCPMVLQISHNSLGPTFNMNILITNNYNSKNLLKINTFSLVTSSLNL